MKIEIELLHLVVSWVACIIWGWGAGMYLATFFVSTDRFIALKKRVEELETKLKR